MWHLTYEVNYWFINNVSDVVISGSITFTSLVESPLGPLLIFVDRFLIVFVTVV